MIRLIAGILRADGLVREAEIRSMLEAMTPDGLPSAAAVHLGEGIGLGVLVLAPRGGAVPERPRIGRLGTALVAADLRRFDGGATGPEACLGEAPAEIHGDFALAVWEEGRLTLWRDRFGVRPLFHADVPGGLAFASLPGALFALGVSRDLDEEVIASLPVLATMPGGRGPFRAIRPLRAAHRLEVRPGRRPDLTRYWRLPIPRSAPLDTPAGEAAAEIRRLLDRAVLRRLPASGPVACHLSGGLDSSAIAMLAERSLGPGRLHAWTFREEAPEGVQFIDERPFVDSVLPAAPGITLHSVANRGVFRQCVDGICPDSMLPLAPHEPEEAVLREASDIGCGTLLSGWGGDQVVTHHGQGAEAELFLRGAWSSLSAELSRRSRRSGIPRWRLFISLVLRPCLPGLLLDRIQQRKSAPSQRPGFVAPAMRGRILREHRPEYPDSRLNRRAWLESWWLENRLELFAQQGARHGIAYAYPMLDADLIEAAMRLPGVLFRRDGLQRVLIRDAMEGLLPDDLRLRREKFSPWPLEGLRIVTEREEMLAELDRLGRSPLVTRFVDTAAIADWLRSGPSEQALREELARHAAEGRQRSATLEAHDLALLLAYFLVAQPGAGQGDADG